MQLAGVRQLCTRINMGKNFSSHTRRSGLSRTGTISRRVLRLFLSPAFALLLGAVAFAGVTASISDTVADASRAAIAGATGTPTHTDIGIVQSQKTNSAGFYSFQSLRPGH